MQNKDAYRHILHVLGTDAVAPELSVGEILELAADWLSGCHPWQFLHRPVRLALRAAIDISGATYTHATRLVTKTGAFASASYVAGDRFELSSATGATAKGYPTAAIVDANNLRLAGDGLGAAANGSIDIAGRLPNDSIALPSDFMAFPDTRPLWATDSVVSKINLSSRAVLTMRRTANTAPETEGSGSFLGAVTELLDPTDGETRPVLELYPPSAADVPDAFQGYYRAHLVIDTSDEANVIPLPQNRPLLRLILLKACRAVALGFEEGEEVSNPPMELLLEQLQGSQLFRAAKKQDGLVQGSMGPLRGGVGGFRFGGGHRTLATEVEGPS